MSLLDYLPSPNEINRCIKPVAEGSHEAVLLAVHQSAKISFRVALSKETVPSSEADLLKHITSANVPTGAMVVPITGQSGVGKSHLIRVIDAVLRSHDDFKRHLIIRVPKSSSLREVVALMLEPLSGAEFLETKEAFSSALAETDREAAAIHMVSHLEVSLKRLAQSLTDELATHSESTTLRAKLGHATQLAGLMSDAETSVHFRQNVLPRIVERAVAGSGEKATSGTEGQFSAEDLRLPPSINLGLAARTVANYYRVALAARGGQGFTEAAGVLNEVVDEAVRNLFRLQDSLGGMTLQEVILQIRRQLLKEGRELILLVEDFAALTGIQESLANVMIQEGVRDGTPEFATMRSVIAVTDGYMVGRQTLATRAAREWVVESEPEGEEEVVRRSRELVAAYINVARWGQEEVVRRYQARRGSTRDAWLPVFRKDDDESANNALQAFGFESDIPLFPYNDAAIRQLSLSALRQDGALNFNPRFLIDRVLRTVVLPSRAALDNGEFPPSDIPAKEPPGDIAHWLSTLSLTESERSRYRRLLMVWGGGPSSFQTLEPIAPEIYAAFGLPIQATPARGDAAGPRVKTPLGVVTPPVPPPDRFSSDVEQARNALELWAQGVQLPQNIASVIRKEVASLLTKHIDFNAERMRRHQFEATRISILGAGGQGRVVGDGSVEIVKNQSDSDGRGRIEMLAVYRLTQASGNSDYSEYEDDLARSLNLVARIRPQALEVARSANRIVLRDAIKALTRNSRILGLGDKSKTPSRVVRFLFAEAPAVEAVTTDYAGVNAWSELTRVAVDVRKRLQRTVINSSGCFQGTGEIPYGLDAVRIGTEWDIDDEDFDHKLVADQSGIDREQMSSMSDAKVKARARAARKDIIQLREMVGSVLGDEFNKNELLSGLKHLVEKLSSRGRWIVSIGMTRDQYLSACEEFRGAGVMESLRQLDGLDPDSDWGASEVIRLARVKCAPLMVAQRFCKATSVFLANAEADVRQLERDTEGMDIAERASSLAQTLAKIDNALAEIAPGAPT